MFRSPPKRSDIYTKTNLLVRGVITVGTASAVFGGIRRYSAVFGGIWRYLAVFGGIWRYLAVFGGIWRYLAVFGGIWRYLAVFGGIWYLCVLCVMSAEWLYTVVGIYQHNGHK